MSDDARRYFLSAGATRENLRRAQPVCASLSDASHWVWSPAFGAQL
jgi:hypothetical protein